MQTGESRDLVRIQTENVRLPSKIENYDLLIVIISKG